MTRRPWDAARSDAAHSDAARSHSPSTRRGSLHVRPGVVVTVLLTAATVAATASIGVTSASFTDQAASALGTDGTVGGAYGIAQLSPDDSVVQGDPDPVTLDTTSSGAVTLDATATATVQTRVVTTTAATGPVHLTVSNAYQGTRPSDPGISGPGIDPFDYALFTISVDGTPVTTPLSASDLNAAGVVIDDWTQNVPKAITVTVQLMRAVGNAYAFNRPFAIGLRFDGATS